MSRRIGAKKICGWDGGQVGLTVSNFLNCKTIENAHKVRKKLLFYIMWLLYRPMQLVGAEEIGACVSRYDQSA